MQYENRQPDDAVNVSGTHPLKQFFVLGSLLLVCVVLLVVVLQFSAGWAAKRIPFSFEVKIMHELDIELGASGAHPKMTEYLNSLAQRVSDSMGLQVAAKDRNQFRFTVHYSNKDVFNAFATIGGNLMFYKGLLEDIPDENTLAMVMAHEIAHIVHRDPVASLGGGVASTLALLALTGSSGSNIAGSVLGNASTLTSMQFTRGMEVAADEMALTALHSLYGHLNGATALFQMFREARGTTLHVPLALERFLSTHPLDDNRLRDVQHRALLEGWFLDGELTPLPENFSNWL